jgi:hypothetical protein
MFLSKFSTTFMFRVFHEKVYNMFKNGVFGLLVLKTKLKKKRGGAYLGRPRHFSAQPRSRPGPAARTYHSHTRTRARPTSPAPNALPAAPCAPRGRRSPAAMGGVRPRRALITLVGRASGCTPCIFESPTSLRPHAHHSSSAVSAPSPSDSPQYQLRHAPDHPVLVLEAT